MPKVSSQKSISNSIAACLLLDTNETKGLPYKTCNFIMADINNPNNATELVHFLVMAILFSHTWGAFRLYITIKWIVYKIESDVDV